MRIRVAVVVALVAAVLVVVVASSARRGDEGAVPARVALQWDANAVVAVRAAKVVDPQGTAPRALYQTEGLLYMSDVQAAVYDAATKIGHRYATYHHFVA